MLRLATTWKDACEKSDAPETEIQHAEAEIQDQEERHMRS